MKQVFITNGKGRSGKDTFAKSCGKYAKVTKYSIINIVKEAATILGCDVNDKSEITRNFLCELKDLAMRYYDSPYQDVKRLVEDFKSDKLDSDILMIDMRDSDDIERAVEDFDAKTILVRNPNNNNEYSNHADSGVENYTDYDYIIVNDAGLYELDKCAKSFVKYIEKCNGEHPLVIMCGSDYFTDFDRLSSELKEGFYSLLTNSHRKVTNENI